MRKFKNLGLKIATFMAITLPIALLPGSFAAQAAETPVGMNVNGFQDFDEAKQDETARLLKKGKVSSIRTYLRLDDKNMKRARSMQEQGIGLVLVTGVVMKAGTLERPKNDELKIRAAKPLSAIDLDLTRDSFKHLFDTLEKYGVKPIAIELGNELNVPGFNSDFPTPGEGKALSCDDLSTDPLGKKVAKGFLLYVKALSELKEARDESKLNHDTPIITCGMATVTGGIWQKRAKTDG